MTRAQIAALVARVEAGETGRELDGAIERLCWPGEPDSASLRAVCRDFPRPFTTSLDAQAALPGRIVNVNRWPQGWVAEVAVPPALYTVRDPGDHFIARAPTEPAARLAALLRAMMETCDE